MANRPQHDVIGLVAGASLAVVMARSRPPADLCWEAIGGAVGGILGSRLPDVLDPPIHPGHRSLAHGVLPMGLLGAFVADQLPLWQASLRARADSLAETGTADGSALIAVVEIILRVSAGFLVGFAAGYASHLLLDATTKRSLPLLA